MPYCYKLKKLMEFRVGNEHFVRGTTILKGKSTLCWIFIGVYDIITLLLHVYAICYALLIDYNATKCMFLSKQVIVIV